MTNLFNFFSFSVFDYGDITSLVNVVRDVCSKHFESGRAIISSEKVVVQNYFDPPAGGNHDDIFSFWKIDSAPDKVFFSSNSTDGRYTLCNVLNMKLKCGFVLCFMSNNLAYPQYYFHHSGSNLINRDILVSKEDSKWEFCTQGEPLKIENLDYYNRRRIKDRLNNDIIISYLHKLGINFNVIDTNIVSSYTFKIKIG